MLRLYIVLKFLLNMSDNTNEAKSSTVIKIKEIHTIDNYLFFTQLYLNIETVKPYYFERLKLLLQLKPFLSLHPFIISNLSFYRCELPN